jgi:hypothetical protein
MSPNSVATRTMACDPWGSVNITKHGAGGVDDFDIRRADAERHLRIPRQGWRRGQPARSVDCLRPDDDAASAIQARRDEIHRRLADKAGHKLVARAVEHLQEAARLLKPFRCHDRYPIGNGRGLLLVVGDIDSGDAQPLLQRPDLGAQLNPQIGFEMAERLIHQEQLRLHDDRTSDRHALTLTARELVRLSFEQRGDSEGRGDFVDPFAQ